MGFRPKSSGQGEVQVKGKDIDAWVEIAFDGVGWVPFYPTPDRDRTPPEKSQPLPKKVEIEQAPPPSTVPPPNTIPDQKRNNDVAPRRPDEDAKKQATARSSWPRYIAVALALPLLVIVLLSGAILALKHRRRRRRRGTGSPAKRVAGGWLEVLDLARDMGRPVPPKATRREAARFLAMEDVAHLAVAADAAIFGAEEPTSERVGELWTRVDAVRRSFASELSWWAWLRTNLSLTSLRARPTASAPRR
jgi:hypothetical protein